MRILGHEAPVGALQDSFGRQFPYLRLSITEVCNFRCNYCLPNGYLGPKQKSFLNVQEIRRLAEAFAELGTSKIRITGGEPVTRSDFLSVVETLAEVDGIKKLAVTTNGYSLENNAAKWRDAGITNLNVSVDSLNLNTFEQITGHKRLSQILRGIDKALGLGFDRIKLNAVLLRGVNDSEISDFLELVRDNPISVRFIELMQTGDNLDYFRKFHTPAKTVSDMLENAGWKRKARQATEGPAVEYGHGDYKGTIGLIAPYSKDFCTGCNRLRVTAKGDLRLCLFGSQGAPLRPLLQEDSQKEELKRRIQNQLSFKRSSHFLAMGDTGVTNNLASVGG